MIISVVHNAGMGLREDHRALTRHKVLEAVLELLAEGSLDELSVPAVARHSGVSLATIYRYFPTKDDLLVAAAAEPSRRVLADGPAPRHDGDDDFAAYQRSMWHDFSKNLPLLRHQLSSEAGRAMRRARLANSRKALSTYLDRFGIDPQSPAGERLISLLLLISGSVAVVELTDRQDLEVDQAVDASLWAVDALISATKQPSPRTPTSGTRKGRQ
jgi:AcrR family transcriptional regulator